MSPSSQQRKLIVSGLLTRLEEIEELYQALIELYEYIPGENRIAVKKGELAKELAQHMKKRAGPKFHNNLSDLLDHIGIPRQKQYGANYVFCLRRRNTPLNSAINNLNKEIQYKRKNLKEGQQRYWNQVLKKTSRKNRTLKKKKKPPKKY